MEKEYRYAGNYPCIKRIHECVTKMEFRYGATLKERTEKGRTVVGSFLI